MQRPLFPARDQFREEAIKYVDGQSSGGGTNIHDSLERCFEMAGKGVTDPAADIDLDTIFFLTDGTPTQGKVTDPEKILEKVREWNKLGRIRVHTIGVGTEQNVDLLRRLARENGGRYVKK